MKEDIKSLRPIGIKEFAISGPHVAGPRWFIEGAGDGITKDVNPGL